MTKPGLAVLVVTGAAASILWFWTLRSGETESAERGFKLEAERRIGAVQQALLGAQERLLSLEAFYASSSEVDEEQFRTFAARCIEHPALRGVVSIATVARDDSPASHYVQFRVGENTPQLSDDLGTKPEFADAIARCEELGAEALSAPVLVSMEAESRVLAVLPIFNRHRESRGMIGGVLDPQRLLPVDETTDATYALWIEDVSAAKSELLAGARMEGEPGQMRIDRDQELGGRWWRISCSAGPGLAASSATWWPWGGLLLGLVMTGLLSAAVASTAGHLRLHQLVESRTAEVRKAYGTLAEEAKERQWAVAETRELERQLSKIIDLAPGMVYVKDWFGRFLFANKATAEAYGTTVQALSASRDVDLNTDVSQPDDVLHADRELMEKGLPSVIPATSFVDAEGRERILRIVKIPCSFGQLGQALLCIATDITDQEYAADILASQSRIIARLAGGADPKEVLEELVHAVEALVPEMRCSVLLLGEDRCLHHCCAPSLPDDYNDALDGLAIAPGLGSCGAAAFSGERVIVDDVMTHPNWAPYVDLARSAGFNACWSEPIRGPRGDILGTFAMYYSKVRTPEPYEEKLIESMAHLAGLAIERGHLRLVRT